jgi:hypothetical protein
MTTGAGDDGLHLKRERRSHIKWEWMSRPMAEAAMRYTNLCRSQVCWPVVFSLAFHHFALNKPMPKVITLTARDTAPR